MTSPKGGMTALVAGLMGWDSLIAASRLNKSSQPIEALPGSLLDYNRIGALRRYMRDDAVDEAAP